jgi:glutamate synthase domain-containing protein 3
LDEKDMKFLRRAIENHVRYTGSVFAEQILKDWDNMYQMFVKVMPIEYRQALERIKKEESKESENVALTEEVFG